MQPGISFTPEFPPGGSPYLDYFETCRWTGYGFGPIQFYFSVHVSTGPYVFNVGGQLVACNLCIVIVVLY